MPSTHAASTRCRKAHPVPIGLRRRHFLARAEDLRTLLHHSPREFGHPTSLWTLDLAAEVSCAEGLTSRVVSGEAIRKTLLRLGIGWQRAKHWITSPDPAYLRKKGGVTA